MLITWAAEAAQYLISQGLALAILAWSQTLSAFGVEVVIAGKPAKIRKKINSSRQILPDHFD
jgi:hypothetical protein